MNGERALQSHVHVRAFLGEHAERSDTGRIARNIVSRTAADIDCLAVRGAIRIGGRTDRITRLIHCKRVGVNVIDFADVVGSVAIPTDSPATGRLAQLYWRPGCPATVLGMQVFRMLDPAQPLPVTMIGKPERRVPMPESDQSLAIAR